MHNLNNSKRRQNICLSWYNGRQWIVVKYNKIWMKILKSSIWAWETTEWQSHVESVTATQKHSNFTVKTTDFIKKFENKMTEAWGQFHIAITWLSSCIGQKHSMDSYEFFWIESICLLSSSWSTKIAYFYGNMIKLPAAAALCPAHTYIHWGSYIVSYMRPINCKSWVRF